MVAVYVLLYILLEILKTQALTQAILVPGLMYLGTLTPAGNPETHKLYKYLGLGI